MSFILVTPPIASLFFKLIYNVVLVSGVQQSDSFMHIYILFHIPFMVYYRILNIVPCAIH